jgi:hypothetical protein
MTVKEFTNDEKSVYRYPFTVYRPSHRMTNKALTHGSRFTVSGHMVSDEMRRPNSQQPEARSQKQFRT